MQKVKGSEIGFRKIGCDACDDLLLEIMPIIGSIKCMAINRRCETCKSCGASPLCKEIDKPKVKLTIIQGGKNE